MQLDNDLSIPPFVAITREDERKLREKLAERDLPGLDFGHRVAIAWLAETHLGWDSMRIHNYLDIEHDITVPLYLIDAFLDTIR